MPPPSPDTLALCLAAVGIGCVHTLLGPDHYLPFAAMARAGDWSAAKTVWVTVLCGLGHVAGSVVIGLVGIALGIAVMRLESLEAVRGDTAAWLLIGFGLAYLCWGLVRAARPSVGSAPHLHLHDHDAEHAHSHPAEETNQAGTTGVWTPWLLFLVFVFGPCEPLIPLLMYPAAKASPWAVAAVVVAFALATVGTMVAAVLAVRSGMAVVRLPRLQRFSHAFAGLAVLACGVLVKAGL